MQPKRSPTASASRSKAAKRPPPSRGLSQQTQPRKTFDLPFSVALFTVRGEKLKIGERISISRITTFKNVFSPCIQMPPFSMAIKFTKALHPEQIAMTTLTTTSTNGFSTALLSETPYATSPQSRFPMITMYFKETTGAMAVLNLLITTGTTAVTSTLPPLLPKFIAPKHLTFPMRMIRIV